MESFQSANRKRDGTISLVIPIYNEERTIPELYRRVKAVADQIPFVEIILVDDGSSDHSCEMIEKISRDDYRFKVLVLSRNFGHQAAIFSGIEHATGDAIVLMDADLQDPPELIPKMIEEWKKGYNVVYGVRIEREGDTFFKKFTASIFYRLMKRFANVDLPLDAGDFRLMDKKVRESLLSMEEYHKFLRGMISWLGFKQVGIPYHRDKRFAGETKYPFRKMLKFAWDGMSSFSQVPLRLAIWIGGAMCGFSFIYIVYALLRNIFGQTVRGWTSLVVLFLLVSGVQLFSIGIVGLYIGKIFEEVKKRPIYLLAKKIGF